MGHGMRYDLNSFALIFSVLISAVIFSSTSFADISVKKPKQLIGIFKAVDGSALSLDGKIYKLYGIQGPTARQKCKKGALPWLCGAAAKKFLSQQINGVVLRCGLTESKAVHCFIKGRELSIIILKAGWAVSTIKSKAHKRAEAYARKKGLGLWPKKR